MAIYGDQQEQVEEEAVEREEAVMPSEMHQFAKLLLKDEDTPEKLKEDTGAFFGKETSLTFFDRGDVNKILNEYDDTIVSNLMNKFPYEFSGKDEKNFTQGRSLLFIKAKRAVGRGKQNERTLLSSQIKQLISEEPDKPSGGILQKTGKAVRGIFGGGRGR